MATEVHFSSKAHKAKEKLSEDYQAVVDLLVQDLRETQGKPHGRGWDNCGPVKQLGDDMMHCHLSKRKPRIVVIWKVSHSKTENISSCICTIEYIGTHEKAPY